MTDSRDISLVPNGRGAQAYFGHDLLGDSACPLDRGQTVTAHIIRGVGILLADPDETLVRDDHRSEARRLRKTGDSLSKIRDRLPPNPHTGQKYALQTVVQWCRDVEPHPDGGTDQ